MKIESVFDSGFLSYGRVVTGYDVSDALRVLETATNMPDGVEYVPIEPALEALPLFSLLQSNEYGGMPIQLGWCNGHNTKLNALEYHRDSELNLGSTDFILLLAKLDDIENSTIDSSKVRAFLCPAGVLIEVYGSTLHYAPCSAVPGEGFRVLVALPRGTNGPMPEMTPVNEEDRLLWACNKWLLAHPESDDAAQGAAVGITGWNIDISCEK